MLEKGNYMLASRVDDWLINDFRQFNVENVIPSEMFLLGKAVQANCPIHEGETGRLFYNVEDIKSQMQKYHFERLECDCVTYMILD